MMKLPPRRAPGRIDIAGLPELKRGGFTGHSHTIGALTTYRQLARRRYVKRGGRTPARVNGATGLPDEVRPSGTPSRSLADPPESARARHHRRRGFAHGDPAADLPTVLLAP